MNAGIEQLYRLLHQFEQGPDGGPALEAYQCPAGRWTLSYGCTKHPDGSDVQQGDTITEAQVYPYVEAAVSRVLEDVRSIVKRPLNTYQEAALCSFVFNLGGKNLRNSTQLLPAIEAGRWEDAAEAMSEFIRAWGRREGHWYRMAMLGLLIRRYAEGLLLLGLDWTEACNEDHIGLPKQRDWQPDWVDPEGARTGGRFFDIVLPGKTDFTIVHEMAKATPLPPLNSELVLSTPAPAVPQTRGNAGPPGTPPSPAPAAPAPSQKPVAAPSLGPAAVPATTKPVALAPTSSPVPAPVGGLIVPKVSLPGETAPAQAQVVPPKPPPLPVPIGQQTSAVDGTRNSVEWSSSPKAMILSRRAWGLFLILFGRLWLLKTGSSAVLGAVSDPLMMEMFGGIMVMIVGEIIQFWGRAKATRPLC